MCQYDILLFLLISFLAIVVINRHFYFLSEKCSNITEKFVESDSGEMERVMCPPHKCFTLNPIDTRPNESWAIKDVKTGKINEDVLYKITNTSDGFYMTEIRGKVGNTIRAKFDTQKNVYNDTSGRVLRYDKDRNEIGIIKKTGIFNIFDDPLQYSIVKYVETPLGVWNFYFDFNGRRDPNTITVRKINEDVLLKGNREKEVLFKHVGDNTFITLDDSLTVKVSETVKEPIKTLKYTVTDTENIFIVNLSKYGLVLRKAKATNI